jgi:hypothetical protein
MWMAEADRGPAASSQSARPQRRGPSPTSAILGVMLGAYFVLAISSLLGKSITVDEFGHLPAGYNTLRTGDFGYSDLNPPLMNSLSALPALLMNPSRSNEPRPGQFVRLKPGHDFWFNGYAFMFDYKDDYLALFTAARFVTVLLVGLLGLLLFFWARLLAPGRADLAGLLAAGLLWFSPNMLAHARLVTTDAGAACFIALAVWSFHLLLRQPNPWRAVGCGVTLGLAQLVKFTAIYLYPVFVITALLWKVLHPTTRGRELALWGMVALVASVVTINAGYRFDGSGARLDSFEAVSDTLKAVQGVLPDATPVLLPREYVAAFDRQMRDVKAGDPSYLFGEPYEGGRWYYFPVLIAFKTPIPLLALGVLAIVVGVRGRGLRWSDAVFLLPAAAFLLMFSFFSNKQLGLRMILPTAPLMFLWVAVTLSRAHWERWVVWPVTGLLVWFAGESLWIHPDYLAYFNQFAGGPANGYHVALDSNLDWGQDLPQLKRFMDENEIESIGLLYFGRVDPEIYGIRYSVDLRGYRPGYRAISTSLYGRWFRLYDHGYLQFVDGVDRTALGDPVASVGHSIHIYRRQAP